MSDLQTVYQRYLAACRAYHEICVADPGSWHRPNVAEFTELKRLLLPYAEGGDILCQYALANISLQWLCCESEEQAAASQESARAEATPWLVAAAKQGYYPALDNLVTSGVGPEAERARETWRQLERERRDLVHWSGNMPVYGPNFMEEVAMRVYRRVIKDSI